MNTMNAPKDTSDSLEWKLGEPPDNINVVETNDVAPKHQFPSKLDKESAAEFDARQWKIQSPGKSSPDISAAGYLLYPFLRHQRVSLAIILAGAFLLAWHFNCFQLLRYIVTTMPLYFLMQVILFVLYGHIFSLGRFSRRGSRFKKPVGQEAAKAFVFSMLIFAPMYLASAVLTVKTLGDAERLFDRGNYQRAAVLYANLDKLLGNESYTLQQARCDEHLGKYQDAADIYSEKLRQYPSMGLYTARAKDFDKLGKTDLAQKDRTEATQLREKLGDAVSAQVFFDNRQLDEALQIYNQMVAQHPKSAKNYVVRAQCLYDLNKYSAAIEDLNHAIVLYPKFGQAFYVRAKAHEKLGEQALATRDRAEAAALHYRHYGE